METQVSIHTPTQGVTERPPNCYTSTTVSIHTPTQGVTTNFTKNYILCRCFNPHTHAGCDINRPPSKLQHNVSIHTPTQGVTVVRYCLWLVICFNPHTHAGCDKGAMRWVDNNVSFNPHTHAGCDVLRVIMIIEFGVSIHTPTQGVTYILWERFLHKLFQSTHPRRVWLLWEW